MWQQNWFQNRRAKAKQQKRQEQYEAQNGPTEEQSKDEDDLEERTQPTEFAASTASSRTDVASLERSTASPTESSTKTAAEATSNSTTRSPPTPVKASDDTKEASWISLQRALNQAKAAQAHQFNKAATSMSPPELPHQSTATHLPLRLNHQHPTLSASCVTAWPSQYANAMPCPSSITLHDTSFDFGFDTSTTEPVVEYMQDSFAVTPEEYEEPLTTPRSTNHHNHATASLPSPEFSMPSYPASRRPSAAGDISATFGDIASAQPSYDFPVADRGMRETIHPPEEGPLDIAARRKRPRPAALTSLSLRSRSYGAMTSISPTFRQNVLSPQGPHSVRHVKSAGQGLHSRYAGIRKVSSAQRSPMCAATFAEAEAFNQLMAHQAIATTPLEELPEPQFSPSQGSHTNMPESATNPFFSQDLNIPTHYGMRAPQNLSITTSSPPVTPMMASFTSRAASQQSLMPPMSAPPQYATFPDYTPPYSAGPLTNSSWSDAPLTSPEVPNFPVSGLQFLGYPQHGENMNGQFQHFVLRSDNKPEMDYESFFDHKKTEFYIQEFPNQKEEHAHAAQQLSQQRPKSFVFANTAPHDYNAV